MGKLVMLDNKRKKKILFVLPSLPYPLTAGGNQAMFNGISAVKDDCELYRTYAIPFYKKDNVNLLKLKQILRNASVVPFVYNPLKGFHNFILWIFFRITVLLKMKKKNPDYFCSQMPSLFNAIRDDYSIFVNSFINENKIDIVQLEMCSTLPLILALPSNVKKVFVHHELNYIVNELQIKSLGQSLYRLANKHLAQILEIGLLNKCDAVITLSEIDKQKLVKDGVKVPIYSSFSIVNTDVKSCNPNNNCNILTFVGPAAHTPNYIGIKWFLENCWTKLLDKDSSYVLNVIGNWPEDKRDEIQQKYKNVFFLGFVPNLADALNNSIMIVPITVGSGIRMKILEAANLEIPFVSTSVGAEGLPFESGRNCFKADTPDTFVNAVVDLKDKSLREKFAKNANIVVKEKYSMDALRKNRLEIYNKVLCLGIN